MSESTAIVLSALIGGLFATVANIVAAQYARRKTGSEARKLDADAAQTVSEAALSLVEPLQKQIDAQQRQIDGLIVKVAYLERALQESDEARCEAETQRDEVIDGANDLHAQIESLGAQPVYHPPARPKKRK